MQYLEQANSQTSGCQGFGVGGNVELLLHGIGVSVKDDAKGLETDSGEGCTAM